GKDWGGAVARALGVERTATAVVLDGERRLRYRGRIDDQFRFGGVRPAPSRDDLALALDDVLAGREVAVAETPVDGCKLTRPVPADRAAPPTFAGEVAAILQRSCVPCHRPGTDAPFALTAYEDAAANADMIAEVVEQGRMPPWFAAPDDGPFENA